MWNVRMQTVYTKNYNKIKPKHNKDYTKYNKYEIQEIIKIMPVNLYMVASYGKVSNQLFKADIFLYFCTCTLYFYHALYLPYMPNISCIQSEEDKKES